MGSQAMPSGAPAAVSPYIDYAQVILTSAENLQRSAKEKYGEKDDQNSWGLLGTDYKVSVSLPKESNVFLKATYVYNSVPTFRESSDKYHHIFIKRTITPFVPIFTAEGQVYKDLSALLNNAMGPNMWLTGHYRSICPDEINFVAVLAVPYKPIPGLNKITAEQLSELISNFLKETALLHAKINEIIERNSTFHQVELTNPNPPPSQKIILPNLSGLINDSFKELSALAQERLRECEGFRKLVSQNGDPKFSPKVRVIVFSASTLSCEAIPYSPEFYVCGNTLNKMKFVFGTAYPMPSFFMNMPQSQTFGLLKQSVALTDQLLPKISYKSFKYVPNLASAKQLNLMYAACQSVKLVDGTKMNMEAALKLFRESVYGISGLNLL